MLTQLINFFIVVKVEAHLGLAFLSFVGGALFDVYCRSAAARPQNGILHNRGSNLIQRINLKM
jgi:hypothetical protein